MRDLIASFYRHRIFSLSSWTLAANILNFAFMPLLARLYSVEAFGIFAIFFSFTTLSAFFSTLRLEMAVPVCKSDAEGKKIANAALASLCLNALLLSFVFYILVASGFLTIEPSRAGILFIAALLQTWFLGMMLIISQVNVRSNNLGVLSFRHITERVAVIGISCLLFKKMPIYGLVLAQVIGQLISMLTVNWGNTWRPRDVVLNWGQIREVFRDYKDFPMRSLPSWMSQSFIAYAAPFVFAIFYPPYELGLYSLAQRMNDAPNTVIQSTISMIYYRRILNADLKDRKRLYLLVFKILVPLSVVGIAFLIPFAGPIFAKLFSEKWRTASVYLLALLPLLIGRIFYFILQPWMYILRRLDIELIVSVAALVAYAASVASGLIFESSLSSIVLLASSSVGLIYFISVLCIYRLVARSVEEPQKLSLTTL